MTDVFLRISGYSIGRASTASYREFIRLIEEHLFDMKHPAPWVQKIARPVE